MHCKILKKYWYKIPFPDNITLIDAVKVIQKYIKMEAKDEKEIKRAQKKKEFVKLCKGALQRNYVYGVFNRNCVFKRKGDKTRFKKG